MVVFLHYGPGWFSLLPGLRFLEPVTGSGGLGIDLFFILSGFILSYVYFDAHSRFGLTDYRRFLWHRIARLYPVHLATLGLLVVFLLAAKLRNIPLTGDYPWTGLPFQLTMTHCWPFCPGGQWNYPSWSISAEWFAYLFIFPIALFFLKSRIRPGLYLLVACGLFALLFGVHARFQQITTPSLALLSVSCKFIAGSAMFLLYKNKTSIAAFCRRHASWIALCFLPLVGLNNIPHRGLIMVCLMPFLILGFTSEESLAARLLATRFFVWTGRISYSVYMIHGVLIKIFKVAMPEEHYVQGSLASRVAVVSFQFLAIFLAAAACYYVVEVPARNWLRRMGKQKSPHKIAPKSKLQSA